MDFKKFYHELSRRNVFRAVAAYLAVAWVVTEIASVILPAFEAPPFVLKGLIYLLAIGLVIWIGFSWIYDLTPQGFRKTGSLEMEPDVKQQNDRRLNTVIIGGVLTAVLLLVAASFWAGSQWRESGSTKPSTRVAVIPLESTQKEEEAFVTPGLTNAIIQTLSELEPLTVLSLASSQYLTAGIAPSKDLISKEVERIDYFLFGTYSIDENTLSLNLELTTELEEASFWQKQYRGDMSEARRLWSEVAKDVSQVMGLDPGLANRVLDKSLRPVQPETYELYLKGKYFLNKSKEEDWKRALVYFQEAVDKNPADPFAYAGLAEGYITLAHNALIPPEGVFPKALAAAKRTIQLDSSNAQGWAALSQYHTYSGWDWEVADYAFRRANTLNPNMAYNHYHRAWYLALFDRYEEAIEEHKRAKEIDPFSSMHTAWLGGLYNMIGEYEKALEEADQASQMEDDYALSNMIRGRAYLGLGEEEKALTAYREAARVNYGWGFLALGPALFELGHREEGMKILKEVEALPETPFYSLCLASMYFRIGNLDQTFHYLEKSKKHAYYPWAVRIFMVSPEMISDPRYEPLLRELNLPPPTVKMSRLAM